MSRARFQSGPSDFTDPSQWPQSTFATAITNQPHPSTTIIGANGAVSHYDQHHLVLALSQALTDADNDSGVGDGGGGRHSLSYVSAHIESYTPIIDKLSSSLSLAPSSSEHHSQWSTWVLLHYVHEARRAIQSMPANPQYPDTRYSHSNTISAFTHSDPLLILATAVTSWLEEVSARELSVDWHSGSVEYRRTLRRLQTTNTDAVFDIDTLTTIDPNDREDETQLLKFVWQLIRAGKYLDAVELCRKYKQTWRAQSLLGAQPWHHTHARTGNHSDNDVGEGGNKNHFLWKHCCHAISLTPSASLYERAIYGLLSSNVAPVLELSQSWEDTLWALVRLTIDRIIDRKLFELTKDPSEQSMAKKLLANNANTVSLATGQSLEGVFCDKHLTQAGHGDIYRRLQFLLIVNKTSEAESLLVTTITNDTPSLSFLVFAAHWYLYHHPRCPSGEALNDSGVVVFEALLNYLFEHNDCHSLVPIYTRYLPPPQQVEFYSKLLFLLSTNKGELNHYISIGLTVFGDSMLEIVNALFDRHYTDSDNDSRMAAIDAYDQLQYCGDVRPLVTLYQIVNANKLLRFFLQKHFFADLQLLVQKTNIQKLYLSTIIADSSDWSVAETELVGYLEYEKSIKFFHLWKNHFAQKPLKPALPSTSHRDSQSLTQQQQRLERNRNERQMKEWQSHHQQWRTRAVELAAMACQQALRCLQHGDAGFLRYEADDDSDGGDNRELSALRSQLVPELLFLLHSTCEESALSSGLLQMADLMVDERYKLYEACTITERRILLKKIQNSFIEFELNKQYQRLSGGGASATVSSDDNEAKIDDDYVFVDAPAQSNRSNESMDVSGNGTHTNNRTSMTQLLHTPLGAIDEQSTDVVPTADTSANTDEESELARPQRSDSQPSVGSEVSMMESESESISANTDTPSNARRARLARSKASPSEPTVVRRSSRLRRDHA